MFEDGKTCACRRASALGAPLERFRLVTSDSITHNFEANLTKERKEKANFKQLRKDLLEKLMFR